jgi:hypothetical protein
MQAKKKAVFQKVAMSCQMKGCLVRFMEVVASVRAHPLFVASSAQSRLTRVTTSRALSLYIQLRERQKQSHQPKQKKSDGQYEGRTRDLGVISTTL